tara:strand:- start:5580 stop:6146 length:567 start_codon:yes stop_codon:yes gene_type:complete
MPELVIKNMVCQRCVMAVEDLLKEMQIEDFNVDLGFVLLSQDLNEIQKAELKEKLETQGFELLDDHRKVLIEQIKVQLRDWVYYQADNRPQTNLSVHLADHFHKDYSSLSRVFSSVEGQTIERYLAKLKMERAKELLVYNELDLGDIAHALDYSNASYLSAQFKKETGMTPTEFRRNFSHLRKPLDAI